MLDCMSERITHFFMQRNFFDEADYRYYYFGFNYIINEIGSWLIAALLAIITSEVLESAVYIFVFMTLRHYCGGFHASTHLRCNIIFMMTYIGFLLLIGMPIAVYIRYIVVIAILFSNIVTFLLAPMESINKKCTIQELKKFRTKAIMYSCLFSIICIVLMNLDIKFSFCIVLGMLNVAFSLIIAYFFERRDKNERLG